MLFRSSIVFPKTHDLDELFDLVPPDCEEVLSFRQKLLGWTAYAVDIRYDVIGYPDKNEMYQALQIAKDFRATVLVLIPSL